MCLSKKILYQCFVVVCFALLGSGSPLKTFHMSLHSTENCDNEAVGSDLKHMRKENVREKATKCYLKTVEVLLDTDGHVLN